MVVAISTFAYRTRLMILFHFNWIYTCSIYLFLEKRNRHKYSIIIKISSRTWISNQSKIWTPDRLYPINYLRVKLLINSELTLRMALKWPWNDPEMMIILKIRAFSVPTSLTCNDLSNLQSVAYRFSMISSNVQLPVTVWHQFGSIWGYSKVILSSNHS